MRKHLQTLIKFDICMNLYEILLETAESFSVHQIYLLDCLYNEWLKGNDNQPREWQEFLKNAASEK